MTLHRSDGSGDTFLFTQYLSKADQRHGRTTVGYNTSVTWPNTPGALGENGNGGHGVRLQGNAGLHRLHRHQLPDPGARRRPRLRPAPERQGQVRAARHTATIGAEAAGFAKKTPANGTISMIYGHGRRRLPDHQLRVRHREQEAVEHAQRPRRCARCSQWAISPKYGNSAHIPEPGQLPAAADQGGRRSRSSRSPRSSSERWASAVTTGERAAASPSDAAIGRPPRRPPAFRRVVDARAGARGATAGGGRHGWPRVLPLARPGLRRHGAGGQGLARPIKVNGSGFFTGSAWKPGSTYAAPCTPTGWPTPRAPPTAPGRSSLGTIQTSVIAVVLAVPISIGCGLRPDRAAAPLDLPAARVRHRAPGRHPERRDRAVGRRSPSARSSPSTSTRSSPTTCPTCPCCATSATRWATARAC